MRILFAHNYYRQRGGEDESTEAEIRMLRDWGHDVDILEENSNKIDQLGLYRSAVRTVWSSQTYKRARSVMRAKSYDILHVQNFFPLLSPSLYYAADSEGVPVVQHIRNYRLICPNASLFRSGHVCEECVSRLIPWPGVQYSCYKESVLASATVSAMIAVHWKLGTWANKVHRYIALSTFVRNKIIQGGIPESRVAVKPILVYPDPKASGRQDRYPPGYALYIGRLSHEKGLSTLCEAWLTYNLCIPLVIVGSGPLKELVSAAAKRNSFISLQEQQPLVEVYRLIRDASVVVVPSIWYEPFGRVIIEAFSLSKPVVVSRLGTPAEVVEDGVTGLHYTPGNPLDLANKLQWAYEHPKELKEMGNQARKNYEKRYTAELNYANLVAVYNEAMREKNLRANRHYS